MSRKTRIGNDNVGWLTLDGRCFSRKHGMPRSVSISQIFPFKIFAFLGRVSIDADIIFEPHNSRIKVVKNGKVYSYQLNGEVQIYPNENE